MSKNRWKITEHSDEKVILALSDSLNVSNILASLLIQRGITNYFEAKKYFRPTLDGLYDPNLMGGMEKASRRVIHAITNNEKIIIYGDYDVDGTCSAAILYLFLKELGAHVETYIPNRLTEGYGISIQSIDGFKERQINLMISVDCGITAVEEVDYANKLGIDTIICDHHQPKEVLPDAHAVLDPLTPGCNYPFKYLSGAGVAFKLALAVAARVGKKNLPFKYLDLVALAGAADIVPLVDENRILVKEGLDLINRSPRPGIYALMKAAKLEPGHLSAGQIVFSIAPRINAVGRLGDANRAVDLFTTNDPAKGVELAQVLEDENAQRRKIDEVTFTHAMELVEENFDLERDMGIVLHDDNWHPGVIGIVASRLVEKFHRPAVMLSTIDGVAKGSARSANGFNIYEALQHCDDLLLQFGGHEAAAGLALELRNIPEFRRRFNEILHTQINHEDIKVPEIQIDSKIHFSDITPKFLRILDQFAPFGPGNMRPVFMSEHVKMVYPPRIVGTNHLVTTLKQSGSEKVFDAIGFNLGAFVNQIDRDKNYLDIVFTIETLTKEGKSFPQIRLKDIIVKD
jgi:single-stranded-DNA-specific exonuclease